MEARKLNQREITSLKWSPFLLGICLLWAAWSLWRGPLSAPYLLICVLVGLVYGASLAISYWKQLTPLWPLWCLVVLLAPQFFVQRLLFERSGWGWVQFSQYFSIVFGLQFLIECAVRGRLTKSTSSHDVEQIVGREPR
jgi:hypothetical protein